MKELKQINPVLRIKAAVFAAMFIFIPVLFMFSLEVDEAELTVSNPEQVEFTNYTGPHTVINTLKEIQDIGKSMAAQAKAGSNPARYGSKYTVIHVVSAAESGKFDADIFILEPDAGVDHIRNLRMILSGYLEDFYAYSFEDAFLLAQFITIYNAVNLSNMAYFAEKYKAAVVGYLVPEKAGLSTYYADWPGKTMMLIPLTEKADTGGIGSLSSDEISEPKVVEELRKQEDKGIPSREDLIDLKERELDQERKDIEKAKQELEAQKKEEPKRPADTVLAAAEKKPPAASDIPASATKPGDAGKPAAEKPPAAKTGEPAAAEKPSAGTPPAAALRNRRKRLEVAKIKLSLPRTR
ncbi:MAG: hypothetical protein E4H36_02270 [Spirochaetales bacterium]|nr:MAG: hypothetical protein E4H36_02270 [Spirochaetales bacterium]